jgi:hypothetical protein
VLTRGLSGPGADGTGKSVLESLDAADVFFTVSSRDGPTLLSDVILFHRSGIVDRRMGIAKESSFALALLSDVL